MKFFQKKSRRSILSLSLIGIILVAGCAGAGPEALAKALPDVQKFLSDHPNADITVALLGPENMKDIAPLLKGSCPQVSAENSYYKVLVKDPDTNSILTVWTDSKTSQVICATRTSAGTAGKVFVPSKVKAIEEVPTTAPAPVVEPPADKTTESTTVTTTNITNAIEANATKEVKTPAQQDTFSSTPKTSIHLKNEATFDLNGDGIMEPVFIIESIYSQAGDNKIFKNDVGDKIVFSDTEYIWPTPNGAKAYYYDGKNYIYSKSFETGSMLIQYGDDSLAKISFSPAKGFGGKNYAEGTFTIGFPGIYGIKGSGSGSINLYFGASPVNFTTVYVNDALSEKQYSIWPADYNCVRLTNGATVGVDLYDDVKKYGLRSASFSLPLNSSIYVGDVSKC